jgi:hypothetical protein
MHNLLLTIAALAGSLGFALTLGGILSLVLPTSTELQDFAERGREANKQGIATQLRAVRENRAQMLDSGRLRSQWSDNRAGRKMLCWGLVLLVVASIVGVLLNTISA